MVGGHHSLNFLVVRRHIRVLTGALVPQGFPNAGQSSARGILFWAPNLDLGTDVEKCLCVHEISTSQGQLSFCYAQVKNLRRRVTLCRVKAQHRSTMAWRGCLQFLGQELRTLSYCYMPIGYRLQDF